ncbi:hypothetical protein HDU97_010356 [Phlyctochytrium planicorne]|nr:hypothetical protein HDU97_010356 [Phlyctochytrium planicorne]
MSIVISQISKATASSTDTTGDCQGNQCVPGQAVIDGPSADKDGDLTWWQSELDPSCKKEWLNLDWSKEGPKALKEFRIIYGPLGDKLNGAKPEITYDTVDGFEATAPPKNPLSVTPDEFITGTFDDTKQKVRQDKYTLKSAIPNVVSLRFTWAPPKNGTGCQINIEEVIVNVDPNPSPQTSSVNTGLVAGIVVPVVLIIGALGVLFAIRRRNLKRRQQTGRV